MTARNQLSCGPLTTTIRRLDHIPIDIHIQIICNTQCWNRVLQRLRNKSTFEMRREEESAVVDHGEGVWVGDYGEALSA